MVAKILSLFKSFKIKKWWKKLLKCVNPLLMGAVLAVTVVEPLTIMAFDYNSVIKIPSKTNGSFYSEIYEMIYYVDNNQANKPVGIHFKDLSLTVPDSFNYTYYLITDSGSPSYYSLNYNLDIADVKMHLIVNSKEYIIEPFKIEKIEINEEKIKSGIRFRFAQLNLKEMDIYTDFSGIGRVSVLCYYEIILSQELNVLQSEINTTSVKQKNYVENYPLEIQYVNNYNFNIGETGISSVDYDNATIDSIERNTEILEEYHNKDKSDAEQAGADMTGFAAQLDNLKNTWEILWYPIEFTNRFVEVFTGGTQAAAYQDEYTYVTGYRYNDETGFLEPIQSMAAQPQSAGTGITFPSFELMGYTIWESYTYDLSQVKEQVPEVFDAIYVIVSILEMLWFVGFLRSKYNEVFG